MSTVAQTAVDRSAGIGGSEIAAILGLDPRRDAYAVYASKLGLVKRTPPNPRMLWGRRLERVIAAAYGEETGQDVRWCDQLMAPDPDRPWILMTPDALVFEADREIGGVDAKNVSFDQLYLWGEPGSEQVPDMIGCQCHWYCSGAQVNWWDVAALFGGNDLRTFRVNRDAEVEAIMHEEAEKFWRKHVLAHVPPPPGPSPATVEALRQIFPKHISQLRPAKPEEMPLLEALKTAKIAAKKAELMLAEAENQIKLVIGDAEGLTFGKEKVTWKKDADSKGTDWKAVARDLYEANGELARMLVQAGGAAAQLLSIERLAAHHLVVTRVGPRKLLTPRAWTRE